MKRQGERGCANWGTYTPDADGICHDCGRDRGWHAGQGCFSPSSNGMPAPVPSRDTCPDCGGERRQLVVAPSRFYCRSCQVAGPGPVEQVAGAQLSMGLA